MYRLDGPEQSVPKASERMASKRSKHSVDSGKRQAQRALGQIDTSLLKKKTPQLVVVRP